MSAQRETRSLSPWVRFLSQLDEWIAVHGDANVPQAAVVVDDSGRAYPLGQRVKSARVSHRRGAMPADRVRDLETRESWSWDGYVARSAAVWEQHIAAARLYVATHGSLKGVDSSQPALARWLREQRTNTLPPDRRRELELIPGALTDRKAQADRFVEAMRSWISAAPDRDAASLRFTTEHTMGGRVIPLGRRAAYWRSRYAAGRLPEAAATKLATLPGWEW